MFLTKRAYHIACDYHMLANKKFNMQCKRPLQLSSVWRLLFQMFTPGLTIG